MPAIAASNVRWIGPKRVTEFDCSWTSAARPPYYAGRMQQSSEPEIPATPFEELFKSIVDRASAKMVYGDPVTTDGKTILPVAKVRYGFGSGSDRGKSHDHRGNGGGGGLIATPAGVVEVTATRTRYVSFTPNWKLIAAAGIGFSLGWAFSKLRS